MTNLPKPSDSWAFNLNRSARVPRLPPRRSPNRLLIRSVLPVSLQERDAQMVLSAARQVARRQQIREQRARRRRQNTEARASLETAYRESMTIDQRHFVDYLRVRFRLNLHTAIAYSGTYEGRALYDNRILQLQHALANTHHLLKNHQGELRDVYRRISILLADPYPSATVKVRLSALRALRYSRLHDLVPALPHFVRHVQGRLLSLGHEIVTLAERVMLSHLAEYHAINAVRAAAAKLGLADSSENFPEVQPLAVFDKMFDDTNPFPYEVDDSPWHYPARADGISQHDELHWTEPGRYMLPHVEAIVARGQERHNRIMTSGPRRVEALGGQFQYLFNDDSSSDEEWDADVDMEEIADEAVQLRRDLGITEKSIVDGHFGRAESTLSDEDTDTGGSADEDAEFGLEEYGMVNYGSIPSSEHGVDEVDEDGTETDESYDGETETDESETDESDDDGTETDESNGDGTETGETNDDRQDSDDLRISEEDGSSE